MCACCAGEVAEYLSGRTYWCGSAGEMEVVVLMTIPIEVIEH